MIHPADRTDTTGALATFQATQAELTRPLGSGDITTGPGTEITYVDGQFATSTRASVGGLTTAPRTLTLDELQVRLSALDAASAACPHGTVFPM